MEVGLSLMVFNFSRWYQIPQKRTPELRCYLVKIDRFLDIFTWCMACFKNNHHFFNIAIENDHL